MCSSATIREIRPNCGGQKDKERVWFAARPCSSASKTGKFEFTKVWQRQQTMNLGFKSADKKKNLNLLKQLPAKTTRYKNYQKRGTGYKNLSENNEINC